MVYVSNGQWSSSASSLRPSSTPACPRTGRLPHHASATAEDPRGPLVEGGGWAESLMEEVLELRPWEEEDEEGKGLPSRCRPWSLGDPPLSSCLFPQFMTPSRDTSCRMPFGLKNAAQSFQRLMDSALRDMPFIFVYLDDVLVASSSEEEHLTHLRVLFTRLDQHGLIINPAKCVFGVPSIKFLGHLITSEGAAPLPSKVDAVSTFPRPRSARGLREFLGMVTFYHRFIRQAAHVMRPLYEALKASAIYYAAVCRAPGSTERDRNRLNKLVRRASSTLGCSLDSVEEVRDRRPLDSVEEVRDRRPLDSVEEVRDRRPLDSVEEVRDRRPLDSVEEVRDRRPLDSVEEVRDRRPLDSGEEVRDRRPLDSGEEVRDRRPLDSVEEVRDRRPLDSVEEVRDRRPLDSVEEVRDRRPLDSVEEVRDRRPLDSGEEVRDRRPLDSVEEVRNRRPLDSVEEVRDRRPLDSVEELRSSFSGRLRHPQCRKEQGLYPHRCQTVQ
uniref:ribonuclease H n=1 Tax=Knipowitschia caucasica TaxID=637954 RepID=A0AAV2M1Y8_KNICA